MVASLHSPVCAACLRYRGSGHASVSHAADSRQSGGDCAYCGQEERRCHVKLTFNRPLCRSTTLRLSLTTLWCRKSRRIRGRRRLNCRPSAQSERGRSGCWKSDLLMRSRCPSLLQNGGRDIDRCVGRHCCCCSGRGSGCYRRASGRCYDQTEPGGLGKGQARGTEEAVAATGEGAPAAFRGKETALIRIAFKLICFTSSSTTGHAQQAAGTAEPAGKAGFECG